MSLRRSAEHEAAHAVLAAHFGLRVLLVEARSGGDGLTRIDGTVGTAQQAAVVAAGDLWEREFCRLPYEDASCSDLARLERSVGATGVWQARRDARAVLTRRREAVLHLADRLEAHGHLVHVAGRGLTPARTIGAQ